MLAERHGALAEPDLDAVLGMVEAVAIAVPPDVQVDLACRAAERGCHLLLEKPLALSVAGADRVVEAADRAGVRSVVFFVRRFVEPSATWFDEVVVPGEWHAGSVTWIASIFGGNSPFGESPWRKQHGALWDLGPHALAALLPALGPVEDVVAVRGHGDEVHLAFPARRRRGELRDAGTDCARGSRTHVHEVLGAGWYRRSSPRRAGLCETDALMRAVSELFAAVETGAAHPCNVHFARDVVSVLADAEHFGFGSAVYPFSRSGMGPVAQLVFKTGAVV